MLLTEFRNLRFDFYVSKNKAIGAATTGCGKSNRYVFLLNLVKFILVQLLHG